MKRNIIIALCVAAVIVIIPVGFRLSHRGSAISIGLIAASSTPNQWIVNNNTATIDQILGTSTVATASFTTVVSSETIPTTATDRLAQNLFEKYVDIRKNGADMTPDISDELADNILAQDYSDPSILYTAQNIKIQADVTPLAIRAYGNKLATIVSAPAVGFESEVEIFQKLADEPVANFTDELTAKRSRYEKMRSQIIALPAPEEIRRVQANVINSLTLFIEAINGAMAMDTDPVGAVPKIGHYGDGVDELTTAFLDYGSYFRTKGIVFDASEKGSLFPR